MSVEVEVEVDVPLCERCEEPIGADRLAALPRTTTCFACASLRKRPSRGRTCS